MFQFAFTVNVVVGQGRSTGDDWSPKAKLAVVIETASMSEAELGAYCREKGLYPEQVQRWKDACHGATAVVALTHDPRIDDLAMMAAVRTPTFYIGVMGEHRTSQTRADRLVRSGGLSDVGITRIHMPIGLNFGSKTPAEIALAVMADILRVRRGRELNELNY